MPTATYDAIVLGVGAVGSCALWQLARRGARVLGIDRFHPPHDRGSSHGHTRIIRQAYFEHPNYVPLLLESYRLWAELEAEAGTQLLRQCGLIQIGPAEGAVVAGVLKSAAQHRLEIEPLTPREIEARWTPLRIPGDLAGVFEPAAGYLHVQQAIEASLSSARRAGAELITDAEAFGWNVAGDVTVRTSAGEFRTDSLVVTAGPWAGQLLAAAQMPLIVRRKVLMWHGTADGQTRVENGFPCFLFELPDGVFYGFPVIDHCGLKAAEHTGGDAVGDPLLIDRTLRASDQKPLEAFLKRCLPTVRRPCIAHAVCLYTMSPDGHFILDRHPDHEQVHFAAGLSGHGFKFAPVLGRALAETVLQGQTALPTQFLKMKRL